MMTTYVIYARGLVDGLGGDFDSHCRARWEKKRVDTIMTEAMYGWYIEAGTICYTWALHSIW